jgi:MYXO-CTERM domain-containing protein
MIGRAILAAAAASALLCSTPARACSCVWGSDLLAPADGEVGVPTNARIWLGARRLGWWALDSTAPPTVSLENDQGTVPAARSVLASAGDSLTIITPAQELQPSTAYRILADSRLLGSFTTGAGPKLDAPAVPVEVERLTYASGPFSGTSSCGSTNSVYLRIRSDGLIAVLDKDGASTLDPAALSGSAADVSTPKELIGLSSGLCRRNWPGAGWGDSASVRLGTFDIAGNFSGWSEPIEVSIPLVGCGCSAGAGPASGLLVLAGLGALARRGRRPRR